MRSRPTMLYLCHSISCWHLIATRKTCWWFCIVALFGVVGGIGHWNLTAPPAHAASKSQAAAKAAPKIIHDLDKLPEPVRNMIEQIVSAARSGRIEEMRTPYEWNELPPVLSDDAVQDPIAFWKKLSVDGEGREILAVLLNLLSSGYVRLPIGADAENPGLYVWPYFAEIPLKSLTPAQQVEALRLLPPDQFLAMRKSGHYTWWRLAIGADGTWHVFQKGK